ncbi:MAG TPA: DUF4349 domain-containing protein, partial [Fimbriimonadaceae bacterium]|nr:DUF4349 domain-containing protein [Fimbriimonadaceae bacterium]
SQALRQVIKSASMIVAVSDVQKAVDDATLMVRGYGGYLESSSLDNAAGTEKPTGSMTIRIPQTNFEEALTKLRKYGRVESEQSNGDDVTAQVTDIEARIKTLKAEEDSYREILRNARKIADILELRDRISQIRQQIESYDARRLTLRRMAALSTISVRFDGPEKNEPKVVGADKPDTWFKDTYATATGMLKDVGRFVAQVLTFVFVLIPVWVPLALMALWFRKRAFHTEQTA